MNGLRAYGLLLLWQYQRMRRDLVMLVVIQLALAFGIVYGLAFLIPDIDSRSAMFLATGAPTVALLVLGLTVVPQEVSQGKLTGRLEYLAAFPVPRLAPAAADVSFWLLAQLPGTVLSLVVAAVRFDFALDPSPAVVPALALVALTGSSVGYGLAMALRPQAAQQIASFISIGILLFSPITFPADRLPSALQTLHTVLPVRWMADVVRWSVTGVDDTPVGTAFAVVGAWCALGIVVSWRMAVRRV